MTTILNESKFEANGTTYFTTKIQIKNTKWELMTVIGNSNYFNVRHLRTSKVWGSLGKDFQTIEEVKANYKKHGLTFSAILENQTNKPHAVSCD